MIFILIIMKTSLYVPGIPVYVIYNHCHTEISYVLLSQIVRNGYDVAPLDRETIDELLENTDEKTLPTKKVFYHHITLHEGFDRGRKLIDKIFRIVGRLVRNDNLLVIDVVFDREYARMVLLYRPQIVIMDITSLSSTLWLKWPLTCTMFDDVAHNVTREEISMSQFDYQHTPCRVMLLSDNEKVSTHYALTVDTTLDGLSVTNGRLCDLRDENNVIEGQKFLFPLTLEESYQRITVTGGRMIESSQIYRECLSPSEVPPG